MEQGDYESQTRRIRNRKRKTNEVEHGNLSIDDFNEDILERILSYLPTSAFFRLSSVCKRWKSVSSSPTFNLACSSIPSRDPFLFMVDPHDRNCSIVFDPTGKTYRKLNHANLLQKRHNLNSIPVAASSGLVCFRNLSGNFIVSNPVTGSSTELPHLDLQNQSLHAIVMSTTTCSNHHQNRSYKVVLVYGQFPKLAFKVNNSKTGFWEEDIPLSKQADSVEFDLNDDNTPLYFLSKGGYVVSASMERSPSKQYSSVITNKDGEEIVYFISPSGKIVACNLSKRCYSEYPRLLPVFSEYSFDVVECRGEMLVVMLSEFFESASLRLWRYDEDSQNWCQVTAMPPALCHEWYGKKVDINCVGYGEKILICVNSEECCCYVVCDLVENEWVELPKCCFNGEDVKFVSAFMFEPRIEASV